MVWLPITFSEILDDSSCASIGLHYDTPINAKLGHVEKERIKDMLFYLLLLVSDCVIGDWQVSDFFAKLIQRVSPKSYQQALAEVQVSQKFLENFCGDQV